MFSGSWKESNEEHITLEIPDDNIDVEGKKISTDLEFVLKIKLSLNGRKILTVMYAT